MYHLYFSTGNQFYDTLITVGVLVIIVGVFYNIFNKPVSGTGGGPGPSGGGGSDSLWYSNLFGSKKKQLLLPLKNNNFSNNESIFLEEGVSIKASSTPINYTNLPSSDFGASLADFPAATVDITTIALGALATTAVVKTAVSPILKSNVIERLDIIKVPANKLVELFNSLINKMEEVVLKNKTSLDSKEKFSKF